MSQNEVPITINEVPITINEVPKTINEVPITINEVPQTIKGSVSRDFRPPVFFMSQPHLGT